MITSACRSSQTQEQGENQESTRMHYYQTQVPDSKKNSHTQKKETKHRNKTKHDLAFPGTLRGFLGEKEIRLEGGPMIFIVVQAVDFHFGLLPPEGGVDLAQGPLPTIKRICLNPPVLRFCPEIPHLQNRPKFDTFGESMSFFEGLIQ